MAKRKRSKKAGNASRAKLATKGNGSKKPVSTRNSANQAPTASSEQAPFVTFRPDLDHERRCREATKEFFRLKDTLRKRKDLVGFDLGCKVSKNLIDGRIAIRVHVDRKLDGLAETNSQCIPKEFGNGVASDVVVRNYHLASPPPRLGEKVVSISTGQFGAAGVYVRTNRSLEYRLITAAHVVSSNFTNEVVVNNSSNQRIGSVGISRASSGADDPDWELDSLVDCALVDLDLDAIPALMQSGLVKPTQSRRVTALDVNNPRISVLKVGPSTQFTTGKITAVHVTRTDTSPVAMEDQFEIVSTDPGQSFAQNGDSGAAVLIGSTIVGLVRAVDQNPASLATVACQFRNVEQSLDVFLA